MLTCEYKNKYLELNWFSKMEVVHYSPEIYDLAPGVWLGFQCPA